MKLKNLISLTGRVTFCNDPEFRRGHDHQKLSKTVILLSGKNLIIKIIELVPLKKVLAQLNFNGPWKNT